MRLSLEDQCKMDKLLYGLSVVQPVKPGILMRFWYFILNKKPPIVLKRIDPTTVRIKKQTFQ